MKCGSVKSDNNTPVFSGTDPNESFVKTLCLGYMANIYSRYPQWDLDTLTFLKWLLDDNFSDFVHVCLMAAPGEIRAKAMAKIAAAIDVDDQINILARVLAKFPKQRLNALHRPVSVVLEKSRLSGKHHKHSTLAVNLDEFASLFGLSEDEANVCIFLALMSSWSHVERYFDTHLDCDRQSGRKYVLAALNMTSFKFESIISGRLARLGFIDVDRRWLELSSDCLPLINESAKTVLSRDHYNTLPHPTVALDNHTVQHYDLDHLQKLLAQKHKSATHILLYGSPGTGKTSFARALAASLKSPAYEVLNNNENKAMGRRLSITACLNLTNHGEGSVVVVDEADGILNTDDGWFMRGESQDKGWLNDLLEEPETRVIWITNRVESIDPSVRRRFAYSLFFPPFGRKKRETIWESVLRKHKIKRLFSAKDIHTLARKFEVSAGAIDLAVSKAREADFDGRGGLLAKINRSLAAHITLLQNGRPVRDTDSHDRHYVLDALNLNVQPEDLLAQIRRFDNWWQLPMADRPVRNFNLLFHGPSGTGKTELARHLAHELDRPLVVKRMSDLLGPYVGQTEQALAGAFARAESDEAILLIDEADSLLFPRSRAHKSWEVSATNEFLTQMERFRGILICTTNRVMDLDDASLRRFGRKVEFGYLKPQGILALYECLLAPLVGEKFTLSLQQFASSLDFLTPGMFKIVREESLLSHLPATHKLFIEALEREARMITERSAMAIGFGSKRKMEAHD
jgi:transitional endoplasmic reticulum ATPase